MRPSHVISYLSVYSCTPAWRKSHRRLKLRGPKCRPLRDWTKPTERQNQPDDLALDGAARYRTVIHRVVRDAAIVPQNEILPRRHSKWPRVLRGAASAVAAAEPGNPSAAQIGLDQPIPPALATRADEDGRWLSMRRRQDLQLVARKAHHPLHRGVPRAHRRDHLDDIAPLR